MGEKDELGCGGATEAVELMEQEAGWSPAPLRLCSSNRPGPVKVKKSRQTGRQTEDRESQTAATMRAVCLTMVTFTWVVRKINPK